MKHFNSLKKVLLAACVAGTTVASAQVHPLAFGSYSLGGTATKDNWYKNYVGLRFEVVSPVSVAGDKVYNAANDGSGATGQWGGVVTAPLINTPIVMPQAGDSLGNTTITVDMTGKIALIYRGVTYFSDKALAAQAAGAIACVIVNNVPGGPVGMAESTTGTTIPVFMISKEDGDALDALYNSGTIANLTITPWGLNKTNDLGFVPGGTALWHAFAIPSNQMGEDAPSAYKMVDGAFIANYGSADQSDVSLSASLSFTPTGGSTTVQHNDTVKLASFPVGDSIYAMFSPDEYSPVASGKGRFDLTYNIKVAGDEYTADNTYTTSFYTTDSLYSKGRYDFTANAPVSTLYEAFGSSTEFLWGPMYYVANGGTAVSSVQYSVSRNATGAFPSGDNTNLLLFKWTDGGNSQPADSIIEDGELDLVSAGSVSYNGTTDSSNMVFTCHNMGAADGTAAVARLDANSWYYLAADVLGGYFLGCDGIQDPYPRIFGRFHATNSMLDYSSLVGGAVTDYGASSSTPDAGNAVSPASSVALIMSIDSFNYSNAKGLIPSVAMIVNNNPPPVAVNNVPGKAFADITLYPNPATDFVNVSTSFEQAANKVTYTLIDGVGRFVSKESHNNVLNEKFSVNTSNLAAGHYFLVVNADGKVMSKKFVVIK